MDFWGHIQIPNWALLTCAIFVILYISRAVFQLRYFTWNFHYWQSQNVIVPDRAFPIFGSMWRLMFQPVYKIDLEHLRIKEKVYGMYEFRNPALIVNDLDLIKELTIKNFHNFTDRRKVPINPSGRIARNFLALLEGEQWKMHRSILSPLFTSGKLRQVCNLMEECGKQLNSNTNQQLPTEKDDMDVKLRFSSYGMDVIATCCFGYKISTTDPDDPFIVHAKLLFNGSFALIQLLLTVVPQLAEIFDISIFPAKCIKYFEKVVHQMITMRKQDSIKHSDFLQLLLDVQHRDAKEDLPNDKSNRVTDNDVFDIGSELTTTKKLNITGKPAVLTEEAVVAHITLFLLAGFESASNAMAIVTYLLALNLDCQEKLAKEIDEQIQKHGKLTSEIIRDMKYLEMVISESLRYLPPAVRLERLCTRDCELGGIKIKKGMMVFVPTYAIHHNEEYYPNPKKFDPERFTLENKAKRNPLTYIPFGIGPRNCVGMRFALQEVKIGLAYFFSEFRVSPSKQTEIPIKFKKAVPFLQPVNGIHLKVEKRK